MIFCLANSHLFFTTKNVAQQRTSQGTAGQIQEPWGCCQLCGVGRGGQEGSGQVPEETPWTSQVELFPLHYISICDPISQPEPCRRVRDVPWQLACVLRYLKISSLFSFPARLGYCRKSSLCSGTLGGNCWVGVGGGEGGKDALVNQIEGKSGEK